MSREVSFLIALDFEGRTAEQVLEGIRQAGYDSVEWTMEYLDTMIGDSPAMACQMDLVTGGEQAVTETFRAIDAAAAQGVPIVNVVTGPNLWEGAEPRSDEAAWSAALGGLERVADYAGTAGVEIGFEPCVGTLAFDAETARRVLDAVPVTITFDPSHFVMTGDPIPDLIREWGERIVHFHLKDAFGRTGVEGEDFMFCLLGEGNVPWPETLAALDEIGYEGALSVEFEAFRYYEQVLGSDPFRTAALCREQVAALLGEGS
ncbi:MAG: sugar phosphate isomerase/epimerase family protein [Vibrio fluvialis]